MGVLLELGPIHVDPPPTQEPFPSLDKNFTYPKPEA